MENRQTGRVIFTMLVLLSCLWLICRQPQKLFTNLPWSEKISLKPGIDMVGGSSLLYQIKVPEGGYHPGSGHTLAEDVMEALKKRVDPDGVKNLIWRPTGDNRLEIQIPASTASAEADSAQTAYLDAQKRLDSFNISEGEVTRAVETMTGADRDAKLTSLAGGSEVRQKLFSNLVKQFDARAKAHAARDAAAEAMADNAYEALKLKIDSTNLRTRALERILLDTTGQRDAVLAQFKTIAAMEPGRLEAVNRFVAAFEAYNKVKAKSDDADQLKRELQGSGVLGFHIAPTNGTQTAISDEEYRRYRRQLEQKGPRPLAGDQLQWFELDRPENNGGGVPWNGKEYKLLWITPERSMVNGPGIRQWSMEKAEPEKNPNTGGLEVGFTFDVMGGQYFSTLTSNNLHQLLATVLDNKIVSEANISATIGSKGTLSSGSGYSEEEVGYLVSTLNAGSLPAQLEDEPISEHKVGPQLGADNLRKGLYACGFGLVIVAIFLIGYYYVAGMVAVFAVFMNVAMILGILSAFGATFTLPGIAGIVLTIGAAVDANVLIFERLREEQHLGLSLPMAMRNAYKHARSAIFDSNATTVITSLILWWLGSEEVKGFGITLLIGLLSSLFTSLFVTRTIFNVLIGTFNVQHLGSFPLTFPKWDKLLKPNIDWLKMAPYFVTFSVIVIVVGMTAFVVKAKQHELADVDFASGTQVQFDLKQPSSIEAVRKIFDDAHDPSLPAPSLTPVGTDGKTYEIITPNVDAKKVREAVLSTLGERIATDLPSKFDHVNETIDQVVAGPALSKDSAAIVPIDTPTLEINKFAVPNADQYLGGAAIVLSNLNPPLTLDVIRARLDRQRLQETSATGPQFHDFTVVSPDGPNVPTKTAIILTVDPEYPYSKDVGKWTSNLADPMWRLVNDSVDRPGTLQKVNNFDAQIAGDTQKAAIFSLVLSSLVIMAYIWFRFGNLKYGTATVLAMIHDVLLVVGAIGLSHWIRQFTPWLADILMIDAFRVNLTIVAAVLTVMSYSMIDTIVVFDRVRENRGRFGHLSRKIVNDSINQTLSRTLLTAGTTIVTVAGMYVVGGPGIHGFTFVLLIGILVGTYSSIAVACPILLMGGDAEEKVSRPATSGNLSGVVPG